MRVNFVGPAGCVEDAWRVYRQGSGVTQGVFSFLHFFHASVFQSFYSCL
jgi:hypothetical protein